MRRHKTKSVILMFLFLIVGPINVYLSRHEYTFYTRAKGDENPRICWRSKEEQSDLRELIRDTHIISQEENIFHMIIDGSLWGAMRLGEPLPWDFDFDMALRYEDVRNIDNEMLAKRFKEKGIDLSFSGKWSSLYKVQRSTARGDLVVYTPSTLNPAKTVRVAYERYLFYLHYHWYQEFPTWLWNQPKSLPKMLFAGMNMTVPRNPLTMQRFMYPNNWWKVVKPAGCETNERNR